MRKIVDSKCPCDAMIFHSTEGMFFCTLSSKKAIAISSLYDYEQSSSSDFVNFTFTGKERDEETGYGYFGARYMDHELMTMWLSVDPMADKYPSLSPYSYCAWNPVKLVDPDGMEIDVSKIYEKNKDGSYKNKYLVAAFKFFANTKYGRNELAKYAKAGQLIAGQKFTKNGEYHNKKIDISFGRDVAYSYHTGGTNVEKNGNRLKISVNVRNITETETVLESICHETFIHASQTSNDFIDDGNYTNHSTMSKQMKEWNVNPAQQEHGEDARYLKRMLNEAVPILREFYSSKGTPRTDSQIIKQINWGMGKYNHIDQ